MEELVSLCKRRGFIFQSNEIYGGLQGLYDYGPLGVELKNNLKQAWWREMVFDRDDVEGLDASILTKPNVLKFSGHEDTFTDPLVDCKDCNSRWRADQLKKLNENNFLYFYHLSAEVCIFYMGYYFPDYPIKLFRTFTSI